jgi:hypothetical protein
MESESTLWFYMKDGDKRGPVDLAEMRSLIASGRVDYDTPVWHGGLGEWSNAGETGLQELFDGDATISGYSDEDLTGIARWLIVMAVSLVIGLVSGAVSIWNGFTTDIQYMSLTGYEHLLFFLGGVAITYLFFSKKEIFPKFNIWFLSVSIAHTLLLHIIFFMQSSNNIEYFGFIILLAVNIVPALAWIWYCKQSRRVALTFVN